MVGNQEPEFVAVYHGALLTAHYFSLKIEKVLKHS